MKYPHLDGFYYDSFSSNSFTEQLGKHYRELAYRQPIVKSIDDFRNQVVPNIERSNELLGSMSGNIGNSTQAILEATGEAAVSHQRSISRLNESLEFQADRQVSAMEEMGRNLQRHQDELIEGIYDVSWEIRDLNQALSQGFEDIQLLGSRLLRTQEATIESLQYGFQKMLQELAVLNTQSAMIESHLREANRLTPKAKEVNENLFRAHNYIKIIHEDQLNWEDAFEHFSEALRLDPKHPLALQGLANLTLHSGSLDIDPFEVRSQLTQATRRFKGYGYDSKYLHGNAYHLARLDYVEGKYEKALYGFQILLKQDLGSLFASVYYGAGRAATALKKYHQAREYFVEAMLRDPAYYTRLVSDPVYSQFTELMEEAAQLRTKALYRLINLIQAGIERGARSVPVPEFRRRLRTALEQDGQFTPVVPYCVKILQNALLNFTFLEEEGTLEDITKFIGQISRDRALEKR